jgi:hypothetical protein
MLAETDTPALAESGQMADQFGRREGKTTLPAVLATHSNVVLGSKRFQTDLNISGAKYTRWSSALASIGNELGYASTCEVRARPSMIAPTGVFR